MNLWRQNIMSHLIMHVNKKCPFTPIRNELQLDAGFCQNDVKSTLSLLKPPSKSYSPEKQHVANLEELGNMSHLVVIVVVVVVVFAQKDEIRDQVKNRHPIDAEFCQVDANHMLLMSTPLHRMCFCCQTAWQTFARTQQHITFFWWNSMSRIEHVAFDFSCESQDDQKTPSEDECQLDACFSEVDVKAHFHC